MSVTRPPFRILSHLSVCPTQGQVGTGVQGRASLLHSLQQCYGSADTIVILTGQIWKLRFNEVKLRGPSLPSFHLLFPLPGTFFTSYHPHDSHLHTLQVTAQTSPLREPFPKHPTLTVFLPGTYPHSRKHSFPHLWFFLSLSPSESPQGWGPGPFTPPLDPPEQGSGSDSPSPPCYPHHSPTFRASAS